VPSWSATHPSQDVLKRMMRPRLYPGPRDIFRHPVTRVDEKRASAPAPISSARTTGTLCDASSRAAVAIASSSFDETSPSRAVLAIPALTRAF